MIFQSSKSSPNKGTSVTSCHHDLIPNTRNYSDESFKSNTLFQFSRSWSPFGQPEVGKLTVIKAGPGFHDEKHYDIGPNGKLTEVTETPIHKDACK